MAIEVTSAALERMLAEAARALPRECCGVLVGAQADGICRVERAVPASNVATQPELHFEIDPSILIAAHRAAREGRQEVLGYYHSHPLGCAKPSVTDRAMAPHDNKIWAIVAGDEVQFWLDAPNRFEPLSYRLVDG